MSDSLPPYGLQHIRLPCPLLSPRVCSNSGPLTRWCLSTISSSVIPFSSCLQSFPASGSFPMSQLLASGDPSIRVSFSASVLPMNIQGWFALGLYPLLKKLTTPVPWCLLAFHEVPHAVREVYFSLNKSTSYLPFFFSYLPFCLSLNSFCNETLRTWVSLSPETRCLTSIKRPWVSGLLIWPTWFQLDTHQEENSVFRVTTRKTKHGIRRWVLPSPPPHLWREEVGCRLSYRNSGICTLTPDSHCCMAETNTIL